jgi:hypothetical protein
MTTHRSLAASLWLLAGVAAFAIANSWMSQAQSGKVSPWALVAFFWGAAGVSMAIHYLSRGAEALKRYRLSPAAARHGAWLRGRAWRPTLAVDLHRLASELAGMRRQLAAQFALIAGTMAACVHRPHPVHAVGPNAAVAPLGQRLELVGPLEAA